MQGPSLDTKLVLAVRPLCSQAARKRSAIYIKVIPTRLMAKNTLREIHEHFAVMMNDMYARPVGGWRGAFVGLKGDWKYQQEVHQHAHFYKADSVCELCSAHASNPATLYSDLREDAGWVATEREPRTVSPLRLAVGFSWFSQFADVLHCVWLGFARDLVGSVLIAMIEVLDEFQIEDANWNERLHIVYMQFRDWASRAHVDHTVDAIDLLCLKIANIKSSYPHFNGKGYDCKVLCARSPDENKNSKKALANSRERRFASESLRATVQICVHKNAR
jgi:hypothetical protein